MIKCLISDLDGTLLLHDGDFSQSRIKQSTVEKLHRLLDEGVHFAIATGRTHSTKELFDEQLGFSSDFIGSNGASVVIENKLVVNKSLDNELAFEVVEMISKQDILVNILFVGSDGYHVEDMAYGWDDDVHQGMLEDGGINHYEIGKFDAWLKANPDAAPLSKLVLIIQNIADRDQLIKNLQDFVDERDIEMFYSADIFVDIMPGGIDKAYGIQAIQNYYGLEDDEIAVVGDSFNDVSMLEKYHKHSFAMATSSADVQAYAKYIVASVDEVIDYIETFNQK